ncbi:dihydrofolate reductase [bacterium]|nr:dihydrofolate reductase [bacterium]
MARVSAIAAIGRNRVLGKDNQLLWHIPDDLKRFKEITSGHPIIMGRKTFESILASLGKPLPGRTNIVVTRDASWQHEGVLTAASIEDAIMKAAKAPGADEVFIGGGGEIYRQALPFTDRLYLTLIEDDKEGDSFFPEYENEFTKVVSDETREHEGLKYRWVDLER